MTTETHLLRTSKIISGHEFANVWVDTNGHHSLHATRPFYESETLANFYAATTHQQASRFTIQTGVNTHIILDPIFLQYINHSCDPNVFFNTATMQLECIRPVNAGDELCFFYPSTEWEMSNPFHCKCASKHCLQFINGAGHLKNEIIARYRFSLFILHLIKLNS